jgi:hypothetical protein
MAARSVESTECSAPIIPACGAPRGKTRPATSARWLVVPPLG